MAARGDSASANSVRAAAGDPGSSTGGKFTLLYSSPDVGQTVEIQPEPEHEPLLWRLKADQKSR